MESLRKLGYTSLSIPAEDVKPLMLLLKTSRGVVNSLNETIEEIWKPVDLLPPPISKDIAMPSVVSGTDSLDMKLETNFNFLQSLTKLFSSDVGASVKYARNGEANFTIDEPKKNYVSIVKLDAFLQDAELRTEASTLMDRLEDGDLYVVTEIVKSNSFTVEAETESDTGGEVKAPVKGVDVGGELVIEKKKKSLIRYKGDQYLAFGFKAYKIFRKSSFLSSKPGSFRIRPADEIKIFMSDEEYPAIQLDNETVELHPIK